VQVQVSGDGKTDVIDGVAELLWVTKLFNANYWRSYRNRNTFGRRIGPAGRSETGVLRNHEVVGLAGSSTTPF